MTLVPWEKLSPFFLTFFLCADYARWIVSVYTAYLVCAKNDDACKMEVSGEH